MDSLNALAQGVVNTEAMKSINYCGALYHDFPADKQIRHAAPLDVHLNHLLNIIDEHHKIIQVSCYRSLLSLCMRLNHVIASQFEMLCRSKCTLTAIHAHYFENAQSNIINDASIKGLLEQLIADEEYYIEWTKSFFRVVGQEVSRNVYAYTLPYCYTDRLRQEIGRFKGFDKFLFTPLLGVSHAHISYLTPCISSQLQVPIKAYIFPELTSSIDHLIELENNEVLELHDLSKCYVTCSELIDIARYADRFSITYSQCLEDLRYKGLLFQESTSRNSEQVKKAGVARKRLFLGLHCRDNSYKYQPHLSYRNSSIEGLIKACAGVYPNAKIIRLGKSGPLVENKIRKMIHMDTNREEGCFHEPSILRKLTKYFGTTSGCGPFIANLYGVDTLLLNVLSPCATYSYTQDLMLSFKAIEMTEDTQSLIGMCSEIKLVSIICGEWVKAPFAFSELGCQRLQEVIEVAEKADSHKRLVDVSPSFIDILGSRALTRIDPYSFQGLKEFFKRMTSSSAHQG